MSDKDPSIPDMPRIAAFADGELEGEDHARLLGLSRQNPHIADRIRHQQQLRQACQRVMGEPAACPPTLCRRIEDLVAVHATPAPPVLARIGRWMPALVAAVLLIGAVMMYQNVLFRPAGSPHLDTILPVATAAQFNNRHQTCSRSLDKLHNVSAFPHELTALPASLTAKLGHPVPTLDLSALGYRFEGAGDCRIPGDGAVHLVYRARPDSGHSDSVSLWICTDDGGLALQPDQTYTRQCPNSGRKVLLWTHAGVRYYLIGDEPARVERIAESLRHAS